MSEPIDSQFFRRVMGQVPTCVTVVTAMVDDEPQAMVIGSFVSVSLDPPLAGFFCTTSSDTWQNLRRAEVLGVNVLAADQVDVSNACMRPAAERFDDLRWELEDGVPRLAGGTAFITLTPHQVIDAGDHEFVLCNVTAMDLNDDIAGPLIFCGGGYRSLGQQLT